MKNLEQINSLRKSLKELRELGAQFKQNLNGIKEAIDADKFPRFASLKTWTDNLSAWMKKSVECAELYVETFNAALPENFSELEKLLDAEEKKIRAENVFVQAENFLRLTTETPDLKKILHDHQTKLKKLLAKRRQHAKSKEVEPYAKFIGVIEESDFDKKFSVSCDLREVFGNALIGRGIFGKELNFDEPENLKDEKISPPEEKPTDTEPLETEPPTVEEDFTKILVDKDALLTENDFAECENFFTVEKKERTKDFSAARFKREFKNADILKPVLQYVAAKGVLSWPAFCPKKISKDFMGGIAQLLLGKGYIKKYSFGERVEFYDLTKNFFDFIKTDAGKKFVGNDRNRNDLETLCFVADKMQYLLVRAAYCHLYNVEHSYKNIFYKMDFISLAAFRLEFVGKVKGNAKRDMFLCSFLENAQDGETFLKRQREYFKREENFSRVFIVGLNLQHAQKMFDVFCEIFVNDFSAAEIYLYDLKADEFYRKDTMEKISAENIWNAPPPEIEIEPEDESELEPEKISGDDAEDETENSFDDEPEEFKIQKSAAPLLDADIKEKILGDVKNFLHDKKFYCATAYLKVQSLEHKEAETLYRQLAFALDDPLLSEGYSAAVISILATEDDDDFNEALITAAAVRALFYNDFGVDYGVPVLHSLTKSFGLLNSNAALANLINDLKNFKAHMLKGVDFYADYRMKDKLAAIENLKKIVGNAKDYWSLFEGRLTDNAYNKTFIKLKKFLFARDGDLGHIFSAIKDENEAYSEDTLNIVKDFLAEVFLKKDAEFTVVNIDAEKLKQFVNDKWSDVSDKKNPGKLTGELENSITNTLERGAEIMCAWVNCAEILIAGNEDSGSLEYKKIRSRLLENIRTARKNLAKEPGAIVVDKTLEEISARLDGTYSKLAKKYFYADFLRSDKIVLDENYLPNLELNIFDGSRKNITEQIKKHAAQKLLTFEKRIEQIFEKGGDDFGSAQLIDDYLKDLNGASFIEQKEYDAKKCMTSAAKDAPRYLKNFIGGMELAQSYGQFDMLPEGEKEKILQLVENCYKYAEESKNFGVFFRVRKYWEIVIEDNATKRGEILKQDLKLAVESYKKEVYNFNAAELKDSVAEIEKIIESRNCTAAQGLIFKLSRGELYKKFDDEEITPLEKFLEPEEYVDCYNRVNDSGTSLEILIGKKISPREKVSRAKLSLVKNWITNPVGEDKIKTLLELLGFSVEAVQKISLPGTNTISFNVKIFGAGQTKYGHPIAAFGSDAEINGFNVACLFGKFDEKNLLEKFKELGNSKHTLVFLDYALDLPTRRRLAKEIKLDKNLTKVFALVDRVAIMYLLKNCAAQLGTKRITDTLMSLVMPFARYQPYIWSPRIPLPPEMFIGRENEINDVMSHGGVNIVCGGRQLGKSALLKMACRKVDGNENECAIFIDIDDKNYREAALLTSRELSDKNFFAEPVETDDWEELTRAIRNRLASDEPTKISYFLLTLDESDKFIESCAENNYAPIVALAKTQQEDYNGSRFKFVIAGLRNIIRFEREQTFSNNNILPTLKPLTVRPFDLEDARKLLEVPLKYLGLYFPDNDNKDSLILTILETANYFPSLIQLYCEKLITALFEPGYAGYDANTPVYRISDEHIKKVLADKDFTKDIKTKIEITLRLGEDKYYYVIANLLAHLYYKQNNSEGYSPRDILDAAENYGLIKEPLLPDSEEKVGALMEELCELNILRKTGDAKYLFSRQRILRIVGTLNEVEDALLKLMTEAEDD